MVILDTDVLIAFSKGIKEIVEKIAKLESKETLATTVLNAEEFLFGAYFLESEKEIDIGKALLRKMKIYDYMQGEVDTVLGVKIRQKKKGNPIGPYDETIAGICMAKNEKLFSLNKKHF